MGHFFFFPFLLFAFLGKLIPLLILGLVIWAIIRAATHSGRPWGQSLWGAPPHTHSAPPVPPYNQSTLPGEQPSAMEILRQRYARGEIDGATFDQMRERLEASQTQSYPPMQQH
jgi:hypothetical protein